MKKFIVLAVFGFCSCTVGAQVVTPASAQKGNVEAPSQTNLPTVANDSVGVQASSSRDAVFPNKDAKQEDITPAEGVKSDAVKKPD
jgi:hypothetical protein